MVSGFSALVGQGCQNCNIGSCQPFGLKPKSGAALLLTHLVSGESQDELPFIAEGTTLGSEH